MLPSTRVHKLCWTAFLVCAAWGSHAPAAWQHAAILQPYPAPARLGPTPLQTAEAAHTPVLVAGLIQQPQTAIASLRREAEDLHEENLLLKERAEAEKAAFQAARESLRHWIKALSVLLAFSLAALGWALWRLQAMKKKEFQTAWNELLDEDIVTTQPRPLDGDTEFGLSAFQMSVLNLEYIKQEQQPDFDRAKVAPKHSQPEAATATNSASHPDAATDRELPDYTVKNSDKLDDTSPIDIRLHLAMAYHDIGDKDGACLLLDEVIREGSPEQAEQARCIRTRMI